LKKLRRQSHVDTLRKKSSQSKSLASLLSVNTSEEDQSRLQNSSLNILYQDQYEGGTFPKDKIKKMSKPKRHKSLASLESDSLFSGCDFLDSGYSSIEHTLDYDEEYLDDCYSGVGTLTRNGGKKDNLSITF
jgi:hypothetical protein